MEKAVLDQRFVMAKTRVKKQLMVWILLELLYIVAWMIHRGIYLYDSMFFISFMFRIVVLLLIYYGIVIGAKHAMIRLGIMVSISWDKNYADYARGVESEMKRMRMIRWKNRH